MRQPERKPIWPYIPGEIISLLKKALVKLTLGRQALKTCGFVAEIMDEFILGLDVLRAYYASVDLGHHMLQMSQEQASRWSPGPHDHKHPGLFWPVIK